GRLGVAEDPEDSAHGGVSSTKAGRALLPPRGGILLAADLPELLDDLELRLGAMAPRAVVLLLVRSAQLAHVVGLHDALEPFDVGAVEALRPAGVAAVAEDGPALGVAQGRDEGLPHPPGDPDVARLALEVALDVA